ncbi:MAG: hypothetical protein AB8B99_24365 [Phormidesmis sp.]
MVLSGFLSGFSEWSAEQSSDAALFFIQACLAAAQLLGLYMSVKCGVRAYDTIGLKEFFVGLRLVSSIENELIDVLILALFQKDNDKKRGKNCSPIFP